MKRLLTEPLFQFLLLGLALFVGHGLWAKHVAKSDYTIEVSAAEIKRQAEIFAAENRRQPTDEDIKALLFAHVEEEVLMREADRLGLAEGDTIIRRRLAQKMRFMIEDAGTPPLPEGDELETWFEQNKSEFKEEPRLSFSHVYFSPQTHGSDIESVAASVQSEVNDANWASLGDPFILQKTYKDQSPTQIKREFGSAFAKSVSDITPGSWSSPIASAYGLHLVRVDQLTPGFQPELSDIRDKVLSAWQDRQRRRENQARLTELLEKYQVEVEDLTE